MNANDSFLVVVAQMVYLYRPHCCENSAPDRCDNQGIHWIVADPGNVTVVVKMVVVVVQRVERMKK
jgi:hypothetical protein